MVFIILQLLALEMEKSSRMCQKMPQKNKAILSGSIGLLGLPCFQTMHQINNVSNPCIRLNPNASINTSCSDSYSFPELVPSY